MGFKQNYCMQVLIAVNLWTMESETEGKKYRANIDRGAHFVQAQTSSSVVGR